MPDKDDHNYTLSPGAFTTIVIVLVAFTLIFLGLRATMIFYIDVWNAQQIDFGNNLDKAWLSTSFALLGMATGKKYG